MSKLTKKSSLAGIVSWCLYDWANSAFPVIITTFVFAVYFTKSVAPNPIIGTANWGKMIAISSLVIGIISPILGAIADNQGRRKPWLGVFSLIGGSACFMLWQVKPVASDMQLALLLVAIATIGYETATVFYNSLLKDIVPKPFIGRISGIGWGVGYIGGLCCLTLVLFFLILHRPAWLVLDTSQAQQIRLCGPIVAIWLLVFAIPLFIKTPDPKTTTGTNHNFFVTLKKTFKQLKNTLLLLKHNPIILRFLIARLFYIDGLNTLFAFGGIYAAGTFNLSFTQIMIFGICMNISAGLGAISFGWLDDKIGARQTIVISLVAILCLGIPLLLIKSSVSFWILALSLSIFIGPVQAASRSYMTHLAPSERINEMFGLMALSGKLTSFIGPWTLGWLTLKFNSQRAGMSVVMLLLLIGLITLIKPSKQSI